MGRYEVRDAERVAEEKKMCVGMHYPTAMRVGEGVSEGVSSETSRFLWTL